MLRLVVPLLIVVPLLVPGAIARAGGITIADELFVGVWSPFASRWEAEAPVCVWGEGAGEAFLVTATGLGAATAFALSDAGGASVGYRVFWRRADRPGRGEELLAGVPSRRPMSGHAQPGCGGGANARIRVRIARGDIDRAPPGIYDDTLLVTLSPL